MAKRTCTLGGPGGIILLTYSPDNDGWSVIKQGDGGVLTAIAGPLLPGGSWATYEEACEAVIDQTGYESYEHNKIRSIVLSLKEEPGSDLLDDPEGL